MMMRMILFVMLALLSFPAISQINLHPISYADSMLHAAPKPSVILISAPWCKWCEKMKASDFTQPILTPVKEEFYFYELDLTSSEDIVLAGTSYAGNSYGQHTLAQSLAGQESVDVPTVIVLNTEMEVVFQNDGYLTAEELLKVLEAM